ncbi:MAG TPA: hypothetical protein VF143_10680, partial [Candidatus Nanopelagicales bacterium]
DLVDVVDPSTGSALVIDGATNFKVVRDVNTNGSAVDQDGTLANKQFSCLVSQSIQAVDGNPDKAVVNERIYVFGDIRLQK